MRGADIARLERLERTFEYNFKITRLYALYLERFPELITARMVDTLTEGTDITREEAIVAILSEAFGLDIDRGAEDRTLIRDYLPRR